MSGKSVRYLRPLDRSQDKHFEKLTQKNQGSVTSLRLALEKTRSRISSLKDANFMKDEVIQEERTMRKAAEDRLDKFLVDLYANPDVNYELRERLPYANKIDPLVKVSRKGSDMIKDEEFGEMAERGMEFTGSSPIHESHQAERLDVVANSSTQGRISSSEANPQSSMSLAGVQADHMIGNQTGHMPDWSSPATYSQSASPEAHLTHSWVSNTSINSSTESSPIVPTASALALSTTAGPYMLPMGPLSSSANSVSSFASLPQPTRQHHSSNYAANPMASASFVSLAASSYIDLPNNHDPKASEETKSQSQKSSSVPNQPGLITESVFGNGTLSPSPTYLASSTTGENVRPLYINPFPPQTPSIHSQRILPDNVSHISRLLAEIATLKKENQELKDKLKASEQKREELKLGIGSNEDKSSQDLGALIEEIRAAEKVRDQTVKKVVQTAEEDKERILIKTSNKQHGRTKELNLPKILSDGELSDVEDGESVNTCDSSVVSEQGETVGSESSGWSPQPHSQQELEEKMQRQRQIMADELQKVIDERNEARQLILKLESKLSALELKPKPEGKLAELLATLGVVRRERDVAVARLKALMAEMAELKLVYSLHKALWREGPQNETSSSERSSKFTNRDHAMTKNNTVSSYFSKHEDMKTKLEARLAFSDKEREVQGQRIDDLEQLVKRQRKKLNELCAGPMLMDGCIETE